MSEKVVSTTGTTWNDYIIADGQIVAIRSKGTSVSWNYIAGLAADSLLSPLPTSVRPFAT